MTESMKPTIYNSTLYQEEEEKRNLSHQNTDRLSKNAALLSYWH